MATGEDQSWMANKKREFMDVSSPKYGNFIGFDSSPYGLIMILASFAMCSPRNNLSVMCDWYLRLAMDSAVIFFVIGC
jgi:hypothetical protein